MFRLNKPLVFFISSNLVAHSAGWGPKLVHTGQGGGTEGVPAPTPEYCNVHWGSALPQVTPPGQCAPV